MSSNQWKTCLIGDIGRIITGKTPSTKNSKNFGNKYPFITPRDMFGQKKVWQTERYLSEVGKNEVKNCLLPANSVCVSCIGSDMGKVALTTQESVTNQQLNSIICEANFDPDFVYYGMVNISSRMKNSAHHSTAVPILNKTDFSNFEFCSPDIDTQKRVAFILSALDNKIELNRQTNETLEAIAQAIYKEWFVNFNFSGATGEMQDSELGPIPKGWRVGEYTNELNIVYGKNLPTVNLLPSGYPVFGGNGLIGFYDKYLYKDPQVIVACRGAASGKVNQSLPNSFVTNNSLVFEIPQKSKVKFTYLKQYCLNTDFTSFVSGSAQPQLTIESFKNAFLLIPEERVLRNFDKLILPVEEIIRENDIQSNCLMQIRYFLLPKLMNGEIDV